MATSTLLFDDFSRADSGSTGNGWVDTSVGYGVIASDISDDRQAMISNNNGQPITYRTDLMQTSGIAIKGEFSSENFSDGYYKLGILASEGYHTSGYNVVLNGQTNSVSIGDDSGVKASAPFIFNDNDKFVYEWDITQSPQNWSYLYVWDADTGAKPSTPTLSWTNDDSNFIPTTTGDKLYFTSGLQGLAQATETMYTYLLEVDSLEENIGLPLNRAPVVTAETASVLAGDSAHGSAGTTGTGALAGDSDPDGDPLMISTVGGSAAAVGQSIAGTYGHLVLNTDGSYSYTADNAAAIAAAPAGHHLHDIFSYTVSDGQGGTAIANLDITLDRAPDAVDDTNSTGTTQFVDDFNRPDGPPGNGWSETNPGNLIIANGVLTLSGSAGGGIFRPADISAPVTVDATITDMNGFGGLLRRYGTEFLIGGDGTGSGYGILVGRGDQNYSDSQITLVQDGVELTHLLSNFQFGATIAVSVTFSPDGDVKGTVSGDGNIFSFDFGPKQTTLYSSNIEIFQNGTEPAIKEATIDNVTINYPNQSYGFLTGIGSTTSGNVLINDSDLDGDKLTVTGVTGSNSAGTVGVALHGSHGDLTLNADGSYSYTVTDLTGLTGGHLHDIFSYTASDGNGGAASADLDIALNRAPVVTAETASVLAGNSVHGSAGTTSTGALADDSDPDGDTLTISAVGGSATAVGQSVAGTYGHLTLNADGSYDYTADNAAAIAAALIGQHLHDTFSYTVDDGQGGTAAASVDITLDRAPTAVSDAATATTGIGGTASGNVLSNDSDPDGDSLTTTAGLFHGSHGDLTLNTDGSYSYTVTDLTGPDGSHLHDVFSYAESDGYGGTASASLDITLNRTPIATADINGTKIGGSASGNVLSNDQDPDDDALAVTEISGGTVGQKVTGTYGTLVLNADGTYSYAVNAGVKLSGQDIAQDSFTYTESDGHGGTTQATLTITVTQASQKYVAGTPGADSNHLSTVSGGNGQGVIDGSLGYENISGGNGADVLIGGPGDVLTGGNGPDTFVFKGNFGRNEITDFDPKNDSIELSHSDFANYASVLANASYDATSGATTIVDGTHGSIVLDHVKLTALHAGDFTFT